MKCRLAILLTAIALAACTSSSPSRRAAHGTPDAFARGSAPEQKFTGDTAACDRAANEAKTVQGTKDHYNKTFDACMRGKGYVKKVQ